MSPAVLAALLCARHAIPHNRFHSFHRCDYGVEQVGGRHSRARRGIVLVRGITASKSHRHDPDPFADHYTGWSGRIVVASILALSFLLSLSLSILVHFPPSNIIYVIYDKILKGRKKENDKKFLLVRFSKAEHGSLSIRALSRNAKAQRPVTHCVNRPTDRPTRSRTTFTLLPTNGPARLFLAPTIVPLLPYAAARKPLRWRNTFRNSVGIIITLPCLPIRAKRLYSTLFHFRLYGYWPVPCELGLSVFCRSTLSVSLRFVSSCYRANNHLMHEIYIRSMNRPLWTFFSFIDYFFFFSLYPSLSLFLCTIQARLNLTASIVAIYNRVINSFGFLRAFVENR